MRCGLQLGSSGLYPGDGDPLESLIDILLFSIGGALAEYLRHLENCLKESVSSCRILNTTSHKKVVLNMNRLMNLVQTGKPAPLQQ